jgi:hypothetical protein
MFELSDRIKKLFCNKRPTIEIVRSESGLNQFKKELINDGFIWNVFA